jgi:hypothetical protein
MMTSEARHLLDSAAESLGLSARAYHRVRQVARTIADLALDDDIVVTHVAEALRYRTQWLTGLTRATRIIASFPTSYPGEAASTGSRYRDAPV